MNENESLTLEDVKKDVANFINKQDLGEKVQLINFKLGDVEYAMGIGQIKEVVITPRIARVPHTPPYLKGVANIRGNIIAIMDLEERFSLSDTVDDKNRNGYSNYTLVVESEEYKVGVLVKEVPNTLSVHVSDIDDSSDIIKFSTLDERCIKGIVKCGEKMIILLDMLALLSIDENFKKLNNI